MRSTAASLTHQSAIANNNPADIEMPPASIHSLPNELVAHILSFLALSPPYFEQRLRDDPANILSDADRRPEDRRPSDYHLKAASLVCQLWRRSVLPHLFGHVVWKFERLDQPPPGTDPADEIGILRFLCRCGLARHVESVTLFIDYPEGSVGADVAQASRWGVFSHDGSPGIASSGNDKATPRGTTWDNNWLWHAIFDHIDPLRITLISSPAILASLLSRTIDLTSSWAFQMRYQIISLSRPSRSVPAPGALITRPSHIPSLQFPPPAIIPCDLFTLRDWSSLLVNEGSSGQIYGTYEFFQHTPPSLIPTILAGEDPSLQPLLRGTLRSLSYVAIFPLSPHITNVLVPHFPPVEHLYFQIVPRGHAFFADDFVRASVDYSDLWVERNIAYAQVLAAIFYGQDLGGAWDSLRVLETGDTADREAWLKAVQFVEQSSEDRGSGWRVEREGLFVKDQGGRENWFEQHITRQ